MSRTCGIIGLCAGSMVGLQVCTAQAPASAQVWDVRFVVDSAGAFTPGATQVGITVFARIGILPNTSASGTSNEGISRVGGAGSLTTGFRVTISDPVSAAAGLSQGALARGRTADIDGRDLLDTAGLPLDGHFAPYRGSFSPQAGPLFLGANSDPTNGETGIGAGGLPTLFNVVGSRQFNYGSEGSGPLGVAAAPDSNPAHLVGDLVPVYRMYYVPRVGAQRAVTIQAVGASGRYLTALHGGGLASSGATTAITIPSATFMIPGPGAFALGLLATVFGTRRRR